MNSNNTKDKASYLSKSWDTSVTLDISDETFWAVVALLFIWIVFSSWWTCDAVFSVPKWQVAWANALVRIFLVNHFNFVDSFAFTLVCDWVYWSWSLAFETFASSSDSAVSVISWAWLALWINWIEEIWSSTFDTVIPNFNESFGTTWFDLEFIPAWICTWESSWALLSHSISKDCNKEDCFEGEVSHWEIKF